MKRKNKSAQSAVRFRTILHYYWHAARKYRWSFFAVFVFFAIGTLISNGVTPYLYRELIDAISASGPRPDVALLYRLFLLIVIASIGNNIAYRIGDYALIRSQVKTLRALANDAFERVTAHSYRFFIDTFVGSLVARTKRYLDAFENLADILAFNFWMSGIQLLSTLVILLMTSPPIAAFFFLWCVVYIGIVVTFVHVRKKYDLAAAETDTAVTARIADVITNIVNIKIFSAQGKEAATFNEHTGEQERARRKSWNFEIVMYGTQGTLVMILEIVGMYLAIRLWLAGAISVGTVVLVQFSFGRIFGSLWALGQSISRFTRALSNASELVEVFEEKPDILDPAVPEHSHIKKGEIVFKNVTFAYSKVGIFKNFSLHIAAGEKVGIVGHSGAGKTTITKLILRFADVETGAVMIDGQDVRAIRQDELRAAISYVPQDPILFHRSLRENIAYGKPDSSEEEIVAAAKKAHAHDFISALTEGYETLVGERGIKLSGGERQRVAIARAMLKNAPLLVLDEATSSLDSVSEKYIQEAFADLMRGKTTIVIAHRLSTIQKMDRVIVLKMGAVVEEGTHIELIAHGGVYQTLWEHQVGGFIK